MTFLTFLPFALYISKKEFQLTILSFIYDKGTRALFSFRKDRNKITVMVLFNWYQIWGDNNGE